MYVRSRYVKKQHGRKKNKAGKSYESYIEKLKLGQIQNEMINQHLQLATPPSSYLTASNNNNYYHSIIPSGNFPPSSAAGAGLAPAIIKTVAYDFDAEIGADEELSVRHGEQVVIIENLGDWSFVKSLQTGQMGMVPSSYI